MSSDNRPVDRDDEAPAGRSAAVKKPYQKPAFTREQVFETMALACGKINPTSGACKSVRRNS
jgi:hypothetical protein